MRSSERQVRRQRFDDAGIVHGGDEVLQVPWVGDLDVGGAFLADAWEGGEGFEGGGGNAYAVLGSEGRPGYLLIPGENETEPPLDPTNDSVKTSAGSIALLAGTIGITALAARRKV